MAAEKGLPGHQAQVLIDGAAVTCPSCGQDLTEDGAINFPHPTFADLEIVDGKVQVFQMDAGEADTNAVECSSCGQRLSSEGWQW